MAGCFLFFVFSTSVWEGAATITPLSPLLTSSKMIKSSSASGSQSNLRVCTQKHLCTTLTLLAHFTLDSEFRQSTLFASIDPFRNTFWRAEKLRKGSMDSNVFTLVLYRALIGSVQVVSSTSELFNFGYRQTIIRISNQIITM